MKPMPIAIVAAVVIFGALLFFNREKAPEIEDIEPDQVRVDRVGAEPVEAVEVTEAGTNPITLEPEPKAKALPDLEASDAWLKQEQPEVSGHPYWKRVWEQQHILRRVVTASDLMARGKNPFSQLFFLRPKGDFTVEQMGSEKFLSESNYQRYQGLLTAIETIDAAKAAAYYKTLKPLLQQAYQELGNMDKSWEQTFEQALDEIVNTPLPTHPPELVGHGKVYIFKDEQLEALPPVQKALIRMGNINAGRIIEKVKAFRSSL